MKTYLCTNRVKNMAVCQYVRPLHLSLLHYTLLLYAGNLVRNYDNGVGKFAKDVCRNINKGDELVGGGEDERGSRKDRQTRRKAKLVSHFFPSLSMC